MNNFYISFGQHHIHKFDGKLLDKDTIFVIQTIDELRARQIAFDLFKDKWSFLYKELPDMVYFTGGLIHYEN